MSRSGDRPHRSRVLGEGALVLAGFLALTLVYAHPLEQHFATALPRDLGDPLLVTWILGWDISRIPHAFIGVWNAPIFFPYPDTLAYSEDLLGIAVFVAPVEWIGRNPILTYNVAFVWSFVLAGGGMYLLARSLTGDRWAGAIAGLAFAFCPYRAAQLSHLQVLTSGWMPIALWGLHRYFVRGERWAAAVFAGAFVLGGLSNGYALYALSAAVVVVVGDGLMRARLPRLRMLVDLGAAALAIALVLVPVGYQYYQVRRALGLVRNLGEIEMFSADVTSYLQIDRVLHFWQGTLRIGRPECALFAGATLLVLAAIAILTAWRRTGSAASIYSMTATSWLYVVVGLVAFVLSLGPVPRYGFHRLSRVSPYQWALALVPGLDGLRVPARFAMVVFLALSVLAAIAIARMFGRLPRALRVVVGVGLGIAIFAEGSPGAMTYVRAAGLGNADAPAYAWLASRPPGGLLELPIEGDEPLHTLTYQIETLRHHDPIVNGSSGYVSPLFDFLGDTGSPLADPTGMGDVLRGLRRLGVRYVAVHRILYPDLAEGAAIAAALGAERDQLVDLKSFGWTTVAELRPIEPPRPPPIERRPIPAAAITAKASLADDQLNLAFDGHIDTRWSAGRPQQGDEWIRLTFDRPRRVSRVRFETSLNSSNDYARRLRVEGSHDGTTFDAVLFEDDLLPSVVASMPPAMPFPLDVDFSPTAVNAIRLDQIGHTDRWFWSIDELGVWETP